MIKCPTYACLYLLLLKLFFLILHFILLETLLGDQCYSFKLNKLGKNTFK